LNQTQLANVSALLRLRTKTNKVSWDELVEKLWKKVMEKRGHATDPAEPKNRDVVALRAGGRMET
jgi:hypothetical protein